MNRETETLLLEQKLALEEFEFNKKIKYLPFIKDAEHFTLSTGRLIELKATKATYKQTVFKALNFMNYSLQNPESINFGQNRSFSTIVISLVIFLNSVSLNKRNKAKVLKKFESDRVDKGCKPQSSGLTEIKTLLLKCLEEPIFIEQLTHIEIQFLITLSKTKVAPNADIESTTLTKWFSQYTWLRRDDIGIGSDLYTRLASPRALIRSFEVTIGVSMLAIQKLKYELIDFFQLNNKALEALSSVNKKTNESLTVDQMKNAKRGRAASMLLLIRSAYYQTDNKSAELKAAIVCILHSLSVNSHLKLILSYHFMLEEPLNLKSQKRILSHLFSSQCSELFSLDFLAELFKYSEEVEANTCPVTIIEKKLFQWIMSTQKVQPSDIPKLKFDDFKLLKKVNGNITHIECEYFKGRARDYHVTSSLAANSPIGKALLNFISDSTDHNQSTNPPLCSITHCRAFSEKGKNAKIISLLNTSYIADQINEEHKKTKVVSIFLPALGKLFSNISLINNSKLKSIKNHATTLFSFTAIKNTAVHASSDKFDPTQLLNYNSHTNETERNSYLSEDNLEWKNNCGRVTRAVMNDIYPSHFKMQGKTFESCH